MPDEPRRAVAARDAGLRRIRRLTWRTAAIAVACSALLAAAFGHGVRRTEPTHTGPGTIVIPAQPPKPVQGPGQVSSGAS
jgi:hypothetical protein